MVKKSKNTIALIVILIIGLFVGGLVSYFVHNSAQRNVESYVNAINKVQNNIVQKIPIYSDFIKSYNEENLRAYLLKDHIAVAKRFKLTAIKDNAHLKQAISNRKLVEMQTNVNSGYYFYNVKKELRYLHPSAVKVLHKITDRFEKILKEYVTGGIDEKVNWRVKIALSSALRTLEYQKLLRKKNQNAALESSHSYGVSFDIFYDDYFLQVTQLSENGLLEDLKKVVNQRAGFWLGDSLRRQLRSILTKTLLELQSEGVLYAILERRQKCYHITPRQE